MKICRRKWKCNLKVCVSKRASRKINFLTALSSLNIWTLLCKHSIGHSQSLHSTFSFCFLSFHLKFQLNYKQSSCMFFPPTSSLESSLSSHSSSLLSCCDLFPYFLSFHFFSFSMPFNFNYVAAYCIKCEWKWKFLLLSWGVVMLKLEGKHESFSLLNGEKNIVG